MSTQPAVTGQYLHKPTHVRHTCPIPGGLFGVVSTNSREGTAWQCDCEVVWTVVRVPTSSNGYLTTVAHNEWQRETRKRRRKRLGLRWWQRETR